MKSRTRKSYKKNAYKKRKNKGKKVHTQKIWKMRGCAGKKSYRGGSPDAPFAYSGNMNDIPTTPHPQLAYTGTGGQKGGMVPSPVPPFVASPWGPLVNEWPGVEGSHTGNHFPANTYNVQPEMNPINERYGPGGLVMSGGKRRYLKRRGTKKRKSSKKINKRKRTLRGGGWGVLSVLGTDFQNALRGWEGETPLPSPLPYKDQMFFGRNEQDNLNYLKVG